MIDRYPMVTRVKPVSLPFSALYYIAASESLDAPVINAELNANDSEGQLEPSMRGQ